ncbi:MAG: Gfo/Idh/MocA family oxidoreductase [Draconibacterium sp.]|nr:Gfo/Idh/MocA family oxidoreductase [Draconibacterium sp.]
MTNKINRRAFLRNTLATSAGIILLPTIIPASAIGKNGHVAANDRIVMGFIGVGSQGTGNMKGFLRNPEVQVVSVCDVDKENRDRATGIVGAAYDNKDCSEHKDFREFLAKEKLDTVGIALPDHWHGIIYSAAANAGLDVYAEKPLCRTIDDGKEIVKAVEKNNIIWQTGSQQRSGSEFFRAVQLVRNGIIGDVNYVEVGLPNGGKDILAPASAPIPEGLDWDMWLGPAPKVPFQGVYHWNWRWIMDYSGGQLTDWAGHHIDIALWGTDLEHTGPVEIEGKGYYPRKGIYNTPIEYDIMNTFANGLKMRIANNRKLKHGGGATFYGTEGWINVDRGRLIASDEKLLSAEIPENGYKPYRSRNHHVNFTDCVKSREETIVPAQTGLRAISVALLGEIAMLTERKIKWDPEKMEIIGDDKASRLLKRPYRKPWKI